MPGITVVQTTDARVAFQANALPMYIGFPGFPECAGLRLLHQGPSLIIAAHTADHYPVREWQSQRFHFVVEGKIYNRSDVNVATELDSLAAALFAAHPSAEARLRSWLHGCDGDFVIAIRDVVTNRLVIFNDLLARLPLYETEKADRTWMLSREISILIALASPPLDRISVAQYLLFRYTLGWRTLYDGVQRVPPATLLYISSEGIVRRVLHTWNFDRAGHNYASPEKSCQQLIEHFVNACRVRAASAQELVLSLSGGMDSRTTLAGLLNAGTRPIAVTFRDAVGRSARDADIARSLAEAVGIEAHEIALSMPMPEHRQRLMEIKRGQNSVGMSFLLPFLDTVRERYGIHQLHCTGDGGDKILPDLRPERHLRSGEDWLKFIIERNRMFSLTDAAALAGVDEEAVRAELLTLVEHYPETSWDDRNVHLFIAERAMQWLFEGEDRNRYWLWVATPFYALPVFQAAMEIPSAQKTDYRLYRRFLMTLSPTLSAIPDASFMLPIASPRYIIKRMMHRVVTRFPGLAKDVKRARDRWTGTVADASTLDALRSTRKTASFRSLNPTAIEKVLNNPALHPPDAIANLLTVAITCELGQESERNTHEGESVE